MRLSTEVKDVLGRSEVTGNRLLLPPGQLDRKLYVKVAAALEMIGGRWNKKEQAHLFEESAEAVVADVVATGAVIDLRKEFQFFETPVAVAKKLAEWADLRAGQTVLEPSAGRGRLVEAIRLRHGVEPVACELWEPNREHLRGMGVQLVGEDFLQLTGTSYDRIVANPPFTRQQDIAHASHMWKLLNSPGRLVSVMSPGWTYSNTNAAKAFRSLVESADSEWEMLPDETFKASGTGVDTGVLILDKP